MEDGFDDQHQLITEMVSGVGGVGVVSFVVPTSVVIAIDGTTRLIVDAVQYPRVLLKLRYPQRVFLVHR